MLTNLIFFFKAFSPVAEAVLLPSALRTRKVKDNDRTFTALSNNRTSTTTRNRTRVI